MYKNYALQDQIFLYSFETKSLFTDEEKCLSDKMDRLTHEKNRLRKEDALILLVKAGSITREKFETSYRALYGIKKCDAIYDDYDDRSVVIKDRIKEINEQIPELKEKLKKLFAENTAVRRIREDAVVDGNVISVFESTLTRTLGMKTNQLYKDITIIRIFYYEILKDIMLNGFLWEGEKYICLTASAGQIRTKKVVFIKESAWKAITPAIMCGLSIEKINEKGGININKLLAYMALSNSATNEWKSFDIRKTIVVDDFETNVRGIVDFIDEKTYTIERKEMDVPIAHTDGCGMMLPKVGKKNMMVRAPWVKGLLAVFPYDRFIKEANEREPWINHALVTDIYGQEHDVLAEGIEIIFTKSQFKLWKYYDSWEDYQQKFIDNHCMAGTCNEEEDYISSARINYQMLQSLFNMTYDEMAQLAEKTNSKIRNIASSKDAMLNVFGAGNTPRSMNGFQQCLHYYPELLTDEYTRNTLKQIKKRLVRNARAGKLDIEGKYLFLVPDVYAFCEWLFLKIENPKGLLANGEVYCRPYKDYEKLDCLRSPHLYLEHAVRKNVVDAEKNKWFSPRAIYTSCHDLISKILQFDVDGDKSLVVAEPLLVEIAERHCEGIVPLFYNMAKAGAVHVDNHQMYDGMIAAYSGGKIGQVSNNITKIWNSENINLDAIKLLCMENNFTIDYAKTLYKPTRPQHVNDMISSYTKKKTPHFFVYAKDKQEIACEKKNGSVVNMLEDIIENKRMCFTAKDIGKFDYRLMMQDKNQIVDPDVVKRFFELDGSAYRQISATRNDEEADFGYLRVQILAEMALMAGSVETACDMLIKELFTRKTVAHKSTFWLCFGDVVLENLKNNIGDNAVQCVKCGQRYIRNAPNQRLCEKCASRQKKETKAHICVDCGAEFIVNARNNKKIRCDDCQRIYRRQYKAKHEKARRKHSGAA